MYLVTGLGQTFKPRSPYKRQLKDVTARWSLEIPFKKDFKAFRQELSRAIGWPHSGGLLRDENDKKNLDVYLAEYVARLCGERAQDRTDAGCLSTSPRSPSDAEAEGD